MKAKILLLGLTIAIATSVSSQTYISENSETILKGFQKKGVENSFLLQQNTFKNSVSNENAVFITQLGENNVSVVNTKSNQSKLSLVQKGDNNDIYLNITANTIDEKVIQNGNNHSFTDFSNSANQHNIELLQNGNNQNLIWYGGNSITEDLKVTMQGQTQSVIIRAFN